jgi:hypothetical protein
MSISSDSNRSTLASELLAYPGGRKKESWLHQVDPLRLIVWSALGGLLLFIWGMIAVGISVYLG